MLDKVNSILNELRLSSKDVEELKDLLPLLEVASSPCFVTLGNRDELDIYARYMMYRVQQDFYDLVKECAEFSDMSWDEFVVYIRQAKGARVAAEIVIRETLKDFYRCGSYNFDAKETNFNVGDGSGDMIHFSQLFSPEEGCSHVECLLYHVELTQYKHQLDNGNDYHWADFLTELQQRGSLWDQVWMAFVDALTRLDFKPFWQSEKLAELLHQAKAQEA